MCAEKAEINALLAYLNAKIDHGVVEIVPISRIVPRRCLRSIDPNTDYIKSLAWDDVTVPPIIVQKSTMMVVDGMCRFQAAVLRGDKDCCCPVFRWQRPRGLRGCAQIEFCARACSVSSGAKRWSGTSHQGVARVV